MKKLIDYKDDLIKCSKCGLCQAVCPIYQQTKKENLLTRGKFTILNGIADCKLNFNEQTAKDLDLCLNCDACQKYCPSDIDARKIFVAAKTDFYKEKFLTSYFYFKLKMMFFSFLANIYRLLRFDKLVDLLLSKSIKFPFNKYFSIANCIFSNKCQKNKSFQSDSKKIAYFEGCFAKYINKSTENSTINILQKAGYEVSVIKSECCSISLFYAGNYDEYKKNAIKIVNSIPENIDFIVSDCDSCIAALKDYENNIDEINGFSKKIISITDFIRMENIGQSINFLTSEKVTYHKPCHSLSDTKSLLKQILGSKFVPIEDMCCGFAGDFGLKHMSISREIAKTKAIDIDNSNADIVVTSCPACVLGLSQANLFSEKNWKVVTISEFMDKRCK
ncbi:MAG: (Fe-S)-binding protein [Candidatus Gastranaerophilales bacterium]|nr:(Fe-S)-binding protein [Candidatus Gastranaerophilales bacterium]